MIEIILASQSPRRKELMETLGYSFLTKTADIDETIDSSKGPEEEVVRLAYEKADKVRMDVCGDKIFIGADTIVVLGGEILGKPESLEDARNMLWKLSGSTHRVLTGVAILSEQKEIKWCEVAYVTFKELSEDEIEEYIKTGSPMDKAGSYGIQERGDKFVIEIKGDFDSVVGLPITKVGEILKSLLGEN